MSERVRPAFWQPQPRLPVALRRFLQARLEAGLEDPRRRTALVWTTVLGAPVLRRDHPEGLPEARLLELAEPMVRAIGPEAAAEAVAEAWRADLAAFPDTATAGPGGWLPHPAWAPMEGYLSLRAGVILLALTGRPEDERYLLACAAELFNLSLFHECHEALEALWRGAEGPLKRGLQGLILLACGFHHQQQGNPAGMRSVWRDGLPHLAGTDLETPWGRIGYAGSLAMAHERLKWLEDDPARLWATPSPKWELT